MKGQMTDKKIVSVSMKKRIALVATAFILFFVILVGRIAYLSIVQHDYYSARASSQQLRDTIVSAERGVIYDRNMNILARSATVWTVALVPVRIEEDEVDLISNYLSEKLDVPYEYVKERCVGDGYYSIIKRKVDKPIVDDILAFIEKEELAGITFTQDTKRYYPYGNFASQLLGFVGTDNNGLYGLESYYDSYLSGISGRILTAVNAHGNNMYYEHESVTEAVDGYSLVLTIDEVIQHTLEKALEDACRQHNVKNYACGIIMNAKTGAILAMSTKPDFNPNDPLTITDEKTLLSLEEITDQDEYLDALSAAQYSQWTNRAISDIYEPGSVFKVVTASAALETGTSTLDSQFYCSGAQQVYEDIVMHCAYLPGHGMQNFAEATMHSCNPAFIQMGQALGRHNFYNYFKGYGLTERTGVDLPGEANSVYYTEENMGIVELASCSYGQSNAITPIQMTTAFAACVNGGYLMQPYVVSQVLDSDGNIVEQHEPEMKRQVISKETSSEMCQILEKLVEETNGQNAYVAGYRIGGKSGTGEKLNGQEGEFVASFCAFAPADDPEIVCLILVDGARSYSIYGGVIVAPIVASVMADVLPYLGVEAVYSDDEMDNVEVYVPNVMDYALTSAYAQLQKRGLEYEVVGSGTQVVGMYPYDGTPVAKGSVVYLYTDESEPKVIEVPDFTNQSLSYVQSVCKSIGLNLKAIGANATGAVVVSQAIAPGESVRVGSVIEVDFINKNLND